MSQECDECGSRVATALFIPKVVDLDPHLPSSILKLVPSTELGRPRWA